MFFSVSLGLSQDIKGNFLQPDAKALRLLGAKDQYLIGNRFSSGKVSDLETLHAFAVARKFLAPRLQCVHSTHFRLLVGD